MSTFVESGEPGSIRQARKERLDIIERARHSELVARLAALPCYTEVLITWDGYRSSRCMARDWPQVPVRDVGRRFTNLDGGMEWFITDHPSAVTITDYWITKEPG